MISCALWLAALGAGNTLFEDVHVVKIEKGRYGPRGMPGDIIALKDGRLLLSYTHDAVGIAGRTSADVGKTWSDEFPLAPNPKPPGPKGHFCHPSFLRLGNGNLLMSYIFGADALPYYGHNYLKVSADEGKTWGDQFIMTPYPGYIIMHNAKLVRLSSGRILAPVEYKKRMPSTEDHSGYVAMVCYSDDGGVSWQVSRNDVDMNPHEAQEPHVVELRDGRVMMLFRTYSGYLGRSYSTDRGETWSAGEMVQDLPLPGATGAVSVHRLPKTGDLLLIQITGSRDGKRAPLTAKISRDEGKTWSKGRNIGKDPDDDYGYQSVTFVDDLAIVSFHALDGLHVARIEVFWFYGED
jgi:sialidase-1